MHSRKKGLSARTNPAPRWYTSTEANAAPPQAAGLCYDSPGARGASGPRKGQKPTRFKSILRTFFQPAARTPGVSTKGGRCVDPSAKRVSPASRSSESSPSEGPSQGSAQIRQCEVPNGRAVQD